MARISKAPPFNPVRPPPTKPPPVSKTQDTYTHHTSPVSGPQMTQADVTSAMTPKAKVRVLPDVPMHVVKHGKGDGY